MVREMTLANCLQFDVKIRIVFPQHPPGQVRETEFSTGSFSNKAWSKQKNTCLRIHKSKKYKNIPTPSKGFLKSVNSSSLRV